MNRIYRLVWNRPRVLAYAIAVTMGLIAGGGPVAAQTTLTETTGTPGTDGANGTNGANGTGDNGGNGGNGTAGGSGYAVTTSHANPLSVAPGSTITGGEGGGGGLGGYGGNGGYAQSGGNAGSGGNGGAGGSSISGSDFTLTNQGIVVGGIGGTGGNGGGGGNGALNFPLIGGNGGNGGTGGTGGTGGSGVSGSDFTLVNDSILIGGDGSAGGNGGNGGFYGAHSGAPGQNGGGGNGGAGVAAFGSVTVINAANISGGKADGGAGVRADAIDFSGGGNTLVLESGYSFTGNVVSTSGSTNGGDTLSLGGDTNPGVAFNVSNIVTTLPTSYTGTQYVSFQNFAKIGANTWTLSGINTAVTPWTINQGVLAISLDASLGAGSGTLTFNGGTLRTLAAITSSRAVNLAGNGTLDSDGTSSSFSGAFSGSGGLTITDSSGTNAGVIILTGANTYSGGTTISAGTLEVGDINTPMASITSNVSVNSGGILRGHGSISGNVINDGIVWPGGSVGTLTINGNYTQNADGTLSLDITPSGSSQLLVNGNASIAGTLHLIFAPGTYSNSMVILVKSSALSGTFNTVDATLPTSLNDTLRYAGTNIKLTLMRVAPLDGTLYGNLMRSVDVSQQQALTSVLDVALTPCNAAAPSMQNVTACANGAWAQYTGANLSLDGAGGLNSTGFGVLGGVDHALGNAHVGIEGGVNQLNGHDTAGGNGRVESVHAGIYAGADTGPLVFSGTLDGEHSNYHIQRASGVGAATSSPDGNTLSAALQIAWPLQLTAWQMTPKLGALYQHQKLEGFSENIVSTNELAPGFLVTGVHSTYTSLQPYFAATVQRSFLAHGVTYLPQLSVGYRYDTRNSSPLVNVRAQDGTLLALPGDDQGRGMATVSARITAQTGESWNLYMGYEGLFANKLHDNALSVGFTKHF